jgi:hypothetical protein
MEKKVEEMTREELETYARDLKEALHGTQVLYNMANGDISYYKARAERLERKVKEKEEMISFLLK